MRYRSLTVLAGAGATLLLALPAHATITFTTHALEGDPAPGSVGVFTTLSPPNGNDLGDVVFGGSANAFQDLGYWISSGGVLTNVMFAQTSPPGSSLVYATTFTDLKVANDGDAGAYHLVVDDGTFDSLWRGPPGDYALVALDDDGASSFRAITRAMMLFDDGDNAFRAIDGDFEEGLYFSGAGPTVLVAEEGTTAPGTSVLFTDVRSPIAANDVGDVLFFGDLDAPSGTDGGIWHATRAGASLVARRGDPAPGLGGDLYISLDPPTIADDGEVAFVFRAEGSETTRGLMTGTPGSLSIRLRSGDAAPLPGHPDAVFEFFGDAEMSGSGDLAFEATLEGGSLTRFDDKALFRILDGELSLVARERDVAPGTGGALFRQPQEPLISDLGQVVFTADTDDGEDGLWALHGDGLEPVVRTGDLFDVGGGDLREVDDIVYFTDQRQQQGALGGGGHLVFQLYFTDDSNGIFSAELVPVPEPALALAQLVALGVVVCLRAVRR